MKKKNLGKTLVAVLCVTTVLAGCGNTTNTDALKETIVQNIAGDTATLESLEASTNVETEEVVSTDTTEETATSENTKMTEDSTSTETSEQEAAETEDSKATYSVTDINPAKTMYAIQCVNVRKGPGTEYKKVDILSTNEEVKVTGQSGIWYRLEDGNFVSGKYLTETKVVTSTPTPKPTPTLDSGSSSHRESNNKHSNDGDSGYSDNSGSNSTQEPTPEPTTVPTLEPTSKPTSEPTQEPMPESTPEPTQEPTPEATPEPEECEHDYKYTNTFTAGAPTCSHISWDNYECQKCGDFYSIEMPPTGLHNYVIETETGQASCGEARWVMYICTYCMDRYSEEIYDPDNHVEGGTCYDALGNCYGCGEHIFDVECEHDFHYTSFNDYWWCRICGMGCADPTQE